MNVFMYVPVAPCNLPGLALIGMGRNVPQIFDLGNSPVGVVIFIVGVKGNNSVACTNFVARSREAL